MTVTTTPDPPPTRGRWIVDWDPEDPAFWASRGRPVARRNLWASILAEHLGFSVWSLWSVLVLFLTPETGFPLTAEQKFLLVSVVALVGAVLRVPYTLAVPLLGGRTWTLVSLVALLVPTAAAVVLLQRPDTPFWVLLALAATAGLGGGNFSSSMANINAFFPEREKGWALGLNAGGGNIGVATAQLAGLGVVAALTVHAGHLLPLLYLPLLLVALGVAWRRMDNLAGLRADIPGQLAAVRDRHFWTMALLYTATFGSFIGFSFAFGLLLQTEFDRSALQAASITFLGPALGSLVRPLGGRLADRLGGARVTLWTFVALAAGTGVLVVAVLTAALPLFVGAFAVVFVLTGIGNGSTYKMIPAIHAARAENLIAAGAPRQQALRAANRRASATLGLIGAVGALGGVAINLVLREAFASTGSAMPAFVAFAACYVGCAVLTHRVYRRRPRPRTRATPGTPVREAS